MKLIHSLFLLVLFVPGAFAQTLPPFGTDLPASSPEIKPGKATSQPVDCFSPAKASLWAVENPPTDPAAKPFTIESEQGKPTLRLSLGVFEPGRTTVRVSLPGGGADNGDAWNKNRASYVSFLCKSNRVVPMTLHLLQKGKTPGTFQTGFVAQPGDWQRVILPVRNFGLKNFGKVAGFAFRAGEAPKDGVVWIADLSVGGMPFSDDSWKGRRVSISLRGDWHFTTDPGDQGMQDKWFADGFDDSKWQTLKSGLSWQEQGVVHHGFGWYRQKIMIPKDCVGTPLTIKLCKIPSDDDVWFNGTRIGGFRGEYKYGNWMERSYTVPASLIRYGEANTIALRIWGGDLSFIGDKSGLLDGPLVAEFDPYHVGMKGPDGTATPAELFDLSDARQGKPFQLVFPFPSEIAAQPGTQLNYRLTDFLGNTIASGKTPLGDATGPQIEAVIEINRETAQTIYLRGRIRANLVVEDLTGNPIYSGIRDLDHLTFAKRDETPLPALPEQSDDTPYGKLKLVDEIDCATSLFDDPHPYLQSGFEHAQLRQTPGSPVEVRVSEILGRKGRESENGWFAYRIGRGKLTPHSTYLLRIEYPEDKPRFAPIEIQTGQTYMDVGWKNGVGADDVYDNWPLSHQWQWFDVMVPLDERAVGTGGTGDASSENGFWVYFMNKRRPDSYYSMWSGGPAVSRIRLYEIDPEKNAPVIEKPKDLPHRVLSFDWERQPDHDPGDFVRYAKLMGYSAISPIMFKWAEANLSDPLNGYSTINVDDRKYWTKKTYDPKSGVNALPAVPGKDSEHVRYLEATKRYGIDYIPRFEYGGSKDLPEAARAMGLNGQLTKPNRFATWCANLLNSATWDDLQKTMDHLVKPYVKDNPQFTGVLWRIRCDRMPISYGKADLDLFSKETHTPLPPGGDDQAAAWAAGEMKVKYDDWWHAKRADFHIRLSKLLQSYRPDLTIYYYNWDEDKFALIQPDLTSWAFVQKVVKPLPEGGRAAYEKEREKRKTLTAADYLEVLRTGNFGAASNGINRADYGIRPSLYKDAKGIQIFAPANYLCYASLPDYLNYFQTADGLAVSNVVSYDEIAARSINPKYEGNMIIPAGAPFSMALELLAYFNGDARTLNYTVYTFGRGFADAHRRFAQAFLALPAIPGTVIDQGDGDVKVRTYPSAQGTYLGVAYKGYDAKQLTIKVPGIKSGSVIRNLVTKENVPATFTENGAQFNLKAEPMELDAYLIQ